MIFYMFAKFWDDDRKKGIENELLLNKLNKSQEELKIYASKIAKSSVLEERTRIARDMHDSIGHSLTAIQIQLRTANAFLDIDNNRSRKSINSALEVAKTSLLDTRSVLNDLRSPEKHFSLKNKLEDIINTLKQSGIEVSYHISPDDEGINYACLLALFRFSQESSTNIIKHSHATKVNINLSYSKDEAKITFEDNGIGYDVEDIKNNNNINGMGLQGLTERFETIRGKVIIESKRDLGTKLTAITPKNPIKLIGENNETY